jgi:hypothetical protein
MPARDESEPSDTGLRAASSRSLETPHRVNKSTISAGTEIAASALGIATCALAPELIWQGLGIFFGHATWPNLLSALLIALVFVAFVEPILKRVRELLVGAGSREPTAGSSDPLLLLGLGLAFGVISVCLHDAISAFASGDGGPDNAGVREALRIAGAWAMVPFFLTIAWATVRNRWLSIPTSVIAALSPGIAGWLFGWSPRSIITTAIPSLIILFAGYRNARQEPKNAALNRNAAMVAAVGAVWLGLASIADWLVAVFRIADTSLYSYSDLFIDARFYAGWTLGIFLAAPRNRDGGVFATGSVPN